MKVKISYQSACLSFFMMKNYFLYLDNQQINKPLYDACIYQSVQSNLYGCSWYLDIVSPNWSALIYGNSQEYQAVMPLPIRQKLGFDYILQPLFCQQLGIYTKIYLDKKLHENFIKILYDKIPYTGKYVLNVHNSNLQFPKIEAQIFYTHHVDLSKPYTEIYQNYSSDRKINLKRAKKSNQQIIENQIIEPLIQIFRENTAHKIQGGVHESAYDLLRQIYSELYRRNLVQLFYTQENHEITSGVMLAKHQNDLIYLFNAGKSTFRKNNGRTLILDKIFQKYAETNLIFDFESPSVRKIATFYESFGAKPVPFYQIRYNHLPCWVRTLQKVKKNYRKFRFRQNFR